MCFRIMGTQGGVNSRQMEAFQEAGAWKATFGYYSSVSGSGERPPADSYMQRTPWLHGLPKRERRRFRTGQQTSHSALRAGEWIITG